jgi:hypothetical protein
MAQSASPSCVLEVFSALFDRHRFRLKFLFRSFRIDSSVQSPVVYPSAIAVLKNHRIVLGRPSEGDQDPVELFFFHERGVVFIHTENDLLDETGEGLNRRGMKMKILSFDPPEGPETYGHKGPSLLYINVLVYRCSIH